MSEIIQGMGAGSDVYSYGTSGTAWTWGAEVLADAMRIFWDGGTRKAYLPTVSNGVTKLFAYDEASDSWSLQWDSPSTVGGGTGGGAQYDSAAYYPDAARLYWLPVYAERVVRWTGAWTGTWGVPGWAVATGQVTTGDNTSAPQGLTLHPDLYGSGDAGLVQVRGGAIRAWRASSGGAGAWTTVASLPRSVVNYSSGVYCPSLNGCLVSLGDDSLDAWLVRPGPSATKLVTTLPVYCSSAPGKQSRLVRTPSGTAAILENATARRVWRLNPVSYQWELQPYTHLLRGTSDVWPVAYVDTYGAYMTLKQINATVTQLLWLPPAGF